MPSYSFGPYLVRHPWRANSSRLGEPQKSNLPARHPVFNSLAFFKYFTNLSALPVRDVIRTQSPVSSRTIVTSLSDTAIRPRVPVLTHASMLLLTNPCAEPKYSQPNKSQRHEPKSLGHYVINRSKQKKKKQYS